MMDDDDFGPDDTADDEPEIIISISQSIYLQKRADSGEFASLSEAIFKTREELNLTKIGEDWYSAEVLNRLEKSLGQAKRGETIPGEVVMARLDECFKEIEARTPKSL